MTDTGGGSDSVGRVGVRRKRGLLVLLAALLVAAIVPQLRVKTIEGSARIGPIPGPPQVGTCVSTPGSADLLTSKQPLGSPLASYPALVTVDCHVPHSGEVTSVLTDPATTVQEVRVNPQRVMRGDANVLNCAEADGDYLGVDVFADRPWMRTVFAQSGILGPTTVQRNAGQRWAACVIELNDFSPAADPDAVPAYTGTLRNAANGGVNASLVGNCRTDDDAQVTCAAAHTREDFYLTVTTAPTTREAMMHACLGLVTKLIGIISGDTTNPAVKVSVTGTNPDGQPLSGRSIPAQAQISCGIQTTGPPLQTSQIALAHR